MRGSQKQSSALPFTRLRLFEFGKKRVPFPPRPLPPDEEGRKSSTLLASHLNKTTFAELLPLLLCLVSFYPSPLLTVFQWRSGTPCYRERFTLLSISFRRHSRHSDSWENYISGVRTAGREEKGRSRGSRVEIIVATLIIYLLPALTPLRHFADDDSCEKKRDYGA